MQEAGVILFAEWGLTQQAVFVMDVDIVAKGTAELPAS